MSVMEAMRSSVASAGARDGDAPRRSTPPKLGDADGPPADRSTSTTAEKVRDRAASVVDQLDSATQGLAQGAARTARTIRHRSSDVVRGVAELRPVPRVPTTGADDAMRGVNVVRDGRTLQRATTASKVSSVVGKVALPVGIALGALDIGFAIRRDGGFGPEATKATGRVAGGMTGAYLGALAGTALIPIPGVGTAIGALAGGWLGSVVGERVAPVVAEGVSKAWEGASNVVEDVVDGAKDLVEGAKDFFGGLFD